MNYYKNVGSYNVLCLFKGDFLFIQKYFDKLQASFHKFDIPNANIILKSNYNHVK